MIDYLTKLNIKPDESAEHPCSSIISSAQSSIIWENNTMNKPKYLKVDLTKEEIFEIIQAVHLDEKSDKDLINAIKVLQIKLNENLKIKNYNLDNEKPLTKQEMIKIIESKGNQRTNFFNNLTKKQIDQLNRFAFGDDFIDEDDESKGSLKQYNEE